MTGDLKIRDRIALVTQITKLKSSFHNSMPSKMEDEVEAQLRARAVAVRNDAERQVSGKGYCVVQDSTFLSYSFFSGQSPESSRNRVAIESDLDMEMAQILLERTLHDDSLHQFADKLSLLFADTSVLDLKFSNAFTVHLIIEILPRCRVLSRINLHFCNYGYSSETRLPASSVDALVQSLKQVDTIRHLSIASSGYGSAAVQMSLLEYATQANLRTVDLQGDFCLAPTWFDDRLGASLGLRCMSLYGSLSTDIALEQIAERVRTNNLALEEFSASGGTQTVTGAIQLLLSVRGNLTLRTLSIGVREPVTETEKAALAEAVQNVYGLERIRWLGRVARSIDAADVYLRLNSAGRRYLKEEPFSLEKGVQVLEIVSHDLDCLFCHLRENPGLVCTH